MNHCQVNFEPLGLKVDCIPGISLIEAARLAEVNLLSICGGKGICGKCKIKLVSGEVSSHTEVERRFLKKEEIIQGFRLACQTQVLSDAQVYLPLESISYPQELTFKAKEDEIVFDPVIKEILLTLSTSPNSDMVSDWEMVKRELKGFYSQHVKTVDLNALRNLPFLLRENLGKIRISIRNEEAIDFRPPEKIPLGLALDLGTTNIVAYLINLEDGITLAIQGITNPQIGYGEDVITRIAFAMENGETLLREGALRGVNQLIEKLCPAPERIVEITLAGNTPMHHLFLGLPVKQLGTAPYLPVIKDPLNIKARELGVRSAPGAYIYILPNISGFIGSDHTAMILSTGIYKTDKTVLGIDLGTNTELVLAHRGVLLSTSCASGPAFEGGRISCGMRAQKGAIEKIELKGDDLTFQTIENALPLGICGSGILEAVAELLRNGFLTREGKLVNCSRIRGSGRKKEFILVTKDKSGTGKEITITQKDINEIQFAKAAIRAGIEILLEEMNLNFEEIEEIIIAGGFGTSLNPASAIAIGMLPPLPRERFKLAGNAAGMGARLVLISNSHRKKAEEIAESVSHLELTTRADFPSKFYQALFFP